MARRYSIEGPDKFLYEFDGPENASQEQIMTYAKQLFNKRQAQVIANQNKGTLGDLGTALKQGVARIPEGLAGLADIPVELVTGKNYITEAGKKLADVTGIHPSDYAASLEAEKSAGYQQAQQEANALWKAYDEGKASAGDIATFYAKHPALTATNVVESAPSMVVGGAYGRALKGVGALSAVARGAIGEGAVSAGQLNAAMNEEGGGSRQKALAAALGGAGTAAIAGGSGALARRMGIIDPETFLAGKSGNLTAKELADFEQAAQRGIAARLGLGALQEGVLQELPQSAQEQMFQNWGTGKPIMEGVGRQALEGLLAGAVLGGGFNVLGRGDVNQQIQDRKDAELAAEQAAAEQAQRQATGVMEQQGLFTPQEAPIPEPTLAPQEIPEEVAAEEPAPAVQGELFTSRGAPTREAKASVEAARLQGLPAQIAELNQTPEGRAQLAGNMKLYFPNLSAKERNALRPQIQAGTYGVEPAAPVEGTLTPDLLKTFGITPRNKQYKSLAGANLADPMTYQLLTTAAATSTDFGVKANRILDAFPQFNPNAVQPDLFGVPNAPQTETQTEPVQPDLFGVPEVGTPPIEPRAQQGMGQPVQQQAAAPAQVEEPIAGGVDALSGPVDRDTGKPAGSQDVQPSPLGNFPRVDATKGIQMGPMGLLEPKVVAENKPLYHETNIDGLNAILYSDRDFDARGVFVSDNPDLAIGQGNNKGIKVEFRPNSVSGVENVKPGTAGVMGDMTGREYKTDIIAPRAISKITVPNLKALKGIRAFVLKTLQAQFNRVDNKDGSITFTRKGLETSAPAPVQQPTLAPVPKGEARKAAAALKKEPVATTWGYLSDTPYAKLSKAAKDRVKDAHAQGYLTQELADEIDRIEAGNARKAAAEAATRPEPSLTEEAEALPDIAQPLLADENKQIEEGLRGKTVLQAAKWLSANAPSKSYRIIANILANRFDTFEKAGVSYKFEFTNRLKGGNRGQCSTSLNSATGEIEVKVSIQDSSGGKKYEVVLHELIHAAVDSAIASIQIARRKGKAIPGYAKYVDQISAVANETRKVIRQRIANGTATEFEINALKNYTNAFLNEFEFVTWGLTNSDMQVTLDSIPMGTQGKTLWSEFVNVIRNLLGIPASANTALSEILSASEGLLNVPIADIKNTLTQRSSMRDEIISNQINQQTKTPAFKKWFGDSKIVNEDGSPKVMYHGTPMSWYKPAFEANRIGLIFVTPEKAFANAFSRGNTEAEKKDLEKYNDERGASISPTVLPVFVSSSNPFDSANTTHVTRLFNQLKKNGNVKGNTLADSTIHFGGNSDDILAENFDIYATDMPARQLANGDWSSLEYTEIITALKQLGFDGMYTTERFSINGALDKNGLGALVKNLAVFEPTQVKSAIGNRGTFDATDEIITNQIDPQAQVQAQQAVAAMAGMYAQSNPQPVQTGAQVAANIGNLVRTNPGGAIEMMERKINAFRNKVVWRGATLADDIQRANDNAFRDAYGNVRADILMSQAENTQNITESVFTFGGIEITPDGTVRAKVANHSIDGVFRHAKTLADRIGADTARELVTKTFYAWRAQALLTLPKDEWPINWQQNPSLIPTQAQINAGMAAFNQFPELQAMKTEFIGAKNEGVKFLRQAGFLTAEKAAAFLADDSYAPWFRLKEYDDTLPGLGNMGRMVDLKQMQALKGGSEEVNDMLENMAQVVSWFVRSGVSNHTANQALKTMEQMGTAKPQRSRPTNTNPDNVVMTYVDGKRMFWTVSDPLQLQAFQSVKALNSPVIKAMSKGLGTLRAGIVLFPAFPIRQVIMDTYRAYAQSGVDHPARLVGKVFKSFLSGEAYKAMSADIIEMKKYGVVGSADFNLNDSTRGRAEAYGLQSPEKGITATWLRSPVYKALHNFAYSADLAVRLGVYRQTMEETGDKELAIARAREIINFQKSGNSELMLTLKQLIPFMGAYAQGTDVNYRSMIGRGNSMKSRKAAAAAFWGNMTTLAALTVAYTMAMSGDDEYEEQKGFITDRNFIIPGIGLLPVPPDIGFLSKVIPERITDYILQEGTDNPESVSRLAEGIRGAAGAAYLPPAAVYGITPAIELALNKSFFTDIPIVGQYMQGLEPFQQYTSSTSDLAKTMGGVANISPLQIDYLLKAIGGTAGGALIQMFDVIASDGKIAREKNIILGTFQKKEVGGRYTEEFYETRELVEKTYNTVKAMDEMGNQAGVDEYLSRPEIQRRMDARATISQMDTMLQGARKVRAGIENDPALTPEEKRQQVNELQANVEQMLKEAGIRKMRSEIE